MFKNIQEFFDSMSGDILRDLKILMNFSMDSRNCFSLVLLGQPILSNILMRQPHEALRQRIIISYSFSGFLESEAFNYVGSRFALVGASAAIMGDNAVLSAYGSSGGSIRKLNLIMTKALMIGEQHGKQNIDTDIILAAVNEIELL